MKVVYGKQLTSLEVVKALKISTECGVLFDTARLLMSKNIDTPEKANLFLHPTLKNTHNPFDLNDMDRAVERIKTAKDNKENVLIFGDYDADGVCAVSVLYHSLKVYGINALTVVPERENGYGLNVEIIKEIHEKTPLKLIISVDCGISDKEKIEEIKNYGIDVIITDHHEPPEILPDCIKINPKIKGQKYPFDGLCGTGVAYKLGYALIGEKVNEYLDFVSVATVADNMDLVDENRDMVYYGLKQMNSDKLRYAFRCLLGENSKEITSQTLAFAISPRINAGGRMGDANTSLQLFLEEDEKRIYELAVKLCQYNILRQTDCDEIYKQAKVQIKEQSLYKDSVIMVCGDSWKAGVIGIVAAKLVEDYSKPVIVFANNDGIYKGSARSIDGINIYDAISSSKEYLITYGGHSQASGMSLNKDNLEIFRKTVCKFVDENYQNVSFEKEIYCEWEMKEVLDLRFAKEISLMEPFGIGNKKPVFSYRANSIIAKQIKAGSPHYSFTTDIADMLDFKGEEDVVPLLLPIEKQLIFEPDYSVFNKREYVKGFLKYVVPDYGNLNGCELFVFKNELLKILNKTNDYKFVDEKPQLENGLGTVYAVSDINTLSKYKTNSLNTYLFSSKEKGAKNCIVVSLDKLSDGYDRVVYLDTPICVKDLGVEQTVYSNISGFESIKNLSLERDNFEKVFNYVNGLENKNIVSVEMLAEDNTIGIDKYEFVFCLEVFLELGFFVIDNGSITRNYLSKKPLTDSKIYCTIQEIKGER